MHAPIQYGFVEFRGFGFFFASIRIPSNYDRTEWFRGTAKRPGKRLLGRVIGLELMKDGARK